jgi:hypothetical protein
VALSNECLGLLAGAERVPGVVELLECVGELVVPEPICLAIDDAASQFRQTRFRAGD